MRFRLPVLAGLVPAALAAQPDAAARWTPPVGAAVTRIDLDSVDLTAVTTLSELLQARVPGLVVRSLSGTVGASPELLARGRKSLFGDAQPLLVIDDIVAIGSARSFGFDVDQTTSRLDDVPLAPVLRVPRTTLTIADRKLATRW